MQIVFPQVIYLSEGIHLSSGHMVTCRGWARARVTHLELLLAPPLLLQRHALLVFLEVFAFGGLQIKPRVRERLDVGEQGFDERMEFIL